MPWDALKPVQAGDRRPGARPRAKVVVRKTAANDAPPKNSSSPERPEAAPRASELVQGPAQAAIPASAALPPATAPPAAAPPANLTSPPRAALAPVDAAFDSDTKPARSAAAASPTAPAAAPPRYDFGPPGNASGVGKATHIHAPHLPRYEASPAVPAVPETSEERDTGRPPSAVTFASFDQSALPSEPSAPTAAPATTSPPRSPAPSPAPTADDSAAKGGKINALRARLNARRGKQVDDADDRSHVSEPVSEVRVLLFSHTCIVYVLGDGH